jgi:hypothetical protein
VTYDATYDPPILTNTFIFSAPLTSVIIYNTIKKIPKIFIIDEQKKNTDIFGLDDKHRHLKN